MIERADPGPSRSPLRVAVLAFGAVVLLGTLVSLAIFGANGWMSDDPSGRGQLLGRGIGATGVVAAAIAYVIQRARATRTR